MFRSMSSVLLMFVLAEAAVPDTVQAQSFRVSAEMKNLIENGKYAEAERIALQQQPPDRTLLAWLKIRGGNVKDGLELARQIYPVDLNSDSAEKSVLELVSLVGDASNSEGIALLESFMKRESLAQSESFWLRLLLLYATSPEPQRGERVVEHVLTLNPAPDVLQKPLFEYIAALYRKEQPALALKYYAELRQRVPETRIAPRYQLFFARLLTANDKPLDGLQIIDAIRTEFKDYAAQNAALLLMDSALAYEKLGDIAGATREFNKIIAGRDSGPQFEMFAETAKEKLANYKADEAVRNLTETPPDSPGNNLAEPDEKSRQSRSRGMRTLLIVNLLVGAGIGAFLWRRRRNQKRNSVGKS